MQLPYRRDTWAACSACSASSLHWLLACTSIPGRCRAPAGANNPKAAINIAGVRSDLISIATAERRYFASEGKYASLDELISANYITLARQRPPYTYEVQTSSSGFRVVATRSGDDTSGTPARLSVDENMEFQTSE